MSDKPNNRKLSVFISYAHEDYAIAAAVLNMLQQSLGDVKVFMDTRSIQVGGDITDEIKSSLRGADVLLVVSTGALQSSHAWTGFELGYFEACHSEKEPPPSLRGKVVTICREKNVPSPVANRRYASIGIHEPLFDENEECFESQIEIVENDELVLLLGDLNFTAKGQRLEEREDLRAKYSTKVKELKKAVYLEFKNRIKNIRKPQKQLLIRYCHKQADLAKDDLPANALLTAVGGALEVFGIREEDPALLDVEAKEIPLLGSRGTGCLKAKAVSWETFGQLVSDSPLTSHWCSTLSKVVLSAGRQSVNVDNSQVIVSQDRLRRYRLLLTTSTAYYNGEVEASVYLVEALQRKDYGREDTTLLLKGLHIVCRFRFLFLEPQSEFYWLNTAEWALHQLPNLARQLLAELDFIHTEAKHAQLDKPGAWAAFISLQELQAMGEVWKPIEDSIRDLCAAAISQAGNANELKKTAVELTAQLKHLVDKVTPHNATLLRSMSNKLTELAGNGSLAGQAAAPTHP
jgi:hypothetical protein